MTCQKIINPDVEIIGADSAVEYQISKNAQIYYTGKPMINFDCPFDGTYCRQKHARVLRWCKAVEYNAENKINQVFLTSADMFRNCPLESYDVQCVRRQRYENIIKQEKQR